MTCRAALVIPEPPDLLFPHPKAPATINDKTNEDPTRDRTVNAIHSS